MVLTYFNIFSFHDWVRPAAFAIAIGSLAGIVAALLGLKSAGVLMKIVLCLVALGHLPLAALNLLLGSGARLMNC